ncbi:N-acetylmuramoyl-L-alanine amidase [Tateyamaria sp. ANG-S1]|uniref:N-acetylmuramoyl-L-alanine amidase n=1 Tax=Tateyamaria sp. ANG-S1 TaxID=1577905 RepID=UPI00057E1AA4|nr:N-acetylmuramoyl-L-alanine amidase [Tateyamaria sp. ANG-S1]KIC49022.1 N-acetylmuramoyl-L-alanine amidase [Tateyamaria sp. ANG-S1]
MRAILVAVMMWLCATAVAAQDLSGLARVDPARSAISDGWFGGTEITLGLSQGVPFRVFTLADPARLVVDFREVDFAGVAPETLLPEPGRVAAIRFGAFKPGWSRLVVDLAEPMVPDTIAMPVDASSGQAVLNITLRGADATAFAAQTGAPPDANWAVEAAAPPPVVQDDSFVVVIDPGHGGIDPGAVRETTSEKDLMLDIGIALRDALRRAGGVEVVLTRDTDTFVSLTGRVALAHQVGADAFVSLHADALSQGQARGATVYTLSDEASDAASAQLAAQHDRADILAGVDLSGTDDQVAAVLMDLARTETMPRTDTLATALIDAMDAAGGPMNRRPRREAAFSVLKSADIPSVLVEVGFLSDQRDLANLRDPIWRAVMVEALATGILQWRDDDLAMRPLIRQ